MDSKKSNIIKHILNILLIIIVGLLLSICLIKNNINVLKDDGIQHIIRIQETVNAIKNLESSKVYSNLCNGFGYSWDLFYGNFTSFIPAIICLIIKDEIISFKIFLTLLMILSGISMYISSGLMFKNKKIAFFTSILYMCMPYHLNDMYIRYAVGEFAAFIFIPMVFAGLNSILKHEENKNYLLLIIGASGLIITHLLSSFITAIFSLIFILVNFKQVLNRNAIKKLLICILSILLLTSYYWIPMLQSTITTKYEVYEENKMSTAESVNNNRIAATSLINGSNNQKVFEIGAINIALILISIFTLNKVDKKYVKEVFTFLLMGLFCIVVTTKTVDWTKVPKIFLMIQFPWRMLEFSSYFFSIVAGINFYMISKNLEKIKILKYLDIFVLVLLCLFSTYFVMKDKIDYSREEVKAPTIGIVHLNSRNGTNAGSAKFEYLPVKAYNSIEYIATREDKILILYGDANVLSEEKNGKRLVSKIEVLEKNTIIELPYIYYIGYNIYIDGKEVNYTESEKGFIQVSIYKTGTIKLETKYTGTLLMKISYIASVFGIIVTIYLVVRRKSLKKTEK